MPHDVPQHGLDDGLKRGLHDAVKRGLDVVAGLTALVVLSPLLLIGIVGTKLTSRGPIFFRQTRVGRGGREFSVYKIRTMAAGRTHDPKEIVPLEHPDITAFGRFLRRTKIDEMPQVLSVIGGDMSLIGPRPTIPEQVANYDDFQRQRLLVRPGVTGLAQVNGNAALSWPERIRYDVYYVHHRSLWLDLVILLKTLIVIPLGESRFARPFEQSPYGSGETA